MTTPRSTRVAFWAAFSRILTIAIFAQSFFAGVFLSGELWGRDAHRVNASIAVTVTLIAGIVALMIWLIPKVWRFIVSLIHKVVGLFDRSSPPSRPRADV